MNFFEYQDRARRNSGLLVGLLSLAVVLLIGITTLAAAALVAYSSGQPFNPVNVGTLLGWDTVGAIALTISAVIVLGSFYKLRQLSSGGRTVAEALGGRKINIAQHSDAEKRALNVVEEMAIASGTPVPEVYVLDDDAINAFAAGHEPQDAVIGLTRGCIERLSRDELQGVVAHEFSHIFNGDMRLNIRIVGLLHGILVIGLLGYWLLRGTYIGSSRDNRGRAALFGIGAGLMVIGYTGTFLGNLIKSAVSRQREYLADASAVQFTRSNAGIAGALKKIGGYSGGSQLSSAQAPEFSHMYFASGLRRSFTNLFATHPPLPSRINRLDPDWSGHFPSVESAVPGPQDERLAGIVGVAPLDSAASLERLSESVDNSIGNPGQDHIELGQRLLDSIPVDLRAAAHDPFAARAIVYLLLSHREASQRQKQHAILEKIAHPGVYRELQKLSPSIRAMPACARLPLLDLCIPALRALAPQQYQVFKRNLIKLLRSDGRVELWEWALYRVAMHGIEGAPDGHRVSHNRKALADATRFLLAALAHAGHEDYLAANRAYGAGLEALNYSKTPLPSRSDITLPRLDKAIAITRSMKPLQKPGLLKALAACMAHDGVLEAEEIELLRAVADSLDCPMPPLAVDMVTREALQRSTESIL
ncbi:Zn-dependent protease with chaperone function [Microbulbifer flavimaris]|uniref:Zn-dependent protease with chaperone function n=1 Tax=Microbulbifer flavimaris TaxID=1781068 RepID=A0ABX4HZ31_9GAMM|nr:MULTISPECIES: M48 family metallopeptidase [Microbulbifer]KUJ83237.1 Zn-dependent protease with chaperone function [Microbulbifer sp. ZGT114]PCO05384.1 Zn-dependent protease with chaperone function [Microbulbifer flavimaris]